ncbi:MAG: HIT domain-containing protein [archaeon]
MPQPTPEEMQNMSPEQLAEIQKKNCIFCKIIGGQIPSKKVYSDEKTFGILDINPATPGHVLLLPKDHHQILPQMPDDLIGYMFKVSKYISQAQLKGFKSQGTTIMAANGVVAGQKAPHFMIHVIPRTEGDNIGMVLPKYKLTPEQQNELRGVLQPRINQEFGGVPMQEAPVVQPGAVPKEEWPSEIRGAPGVPLADIPEELFTPKGARLEQEVVERASSPQTQEEFPEEFEDELKEEDINLDKMRDLYR